MLTNIRFDDIPEIERSRFFAELAGRRITGFNGTYSDQTAGELLALCDSHGFVEIAVPGGNAARKLGAVIGAEVLVRWQ